MAKVLISVNQLGTLLSVVIIDVVLAGDNAIVVGMAAAGLAEPSAGGASSPSALPPRPCCASASPILPCSCSLLSA